MTEVRGYYLGIDLGTTNSVVAYTTDRTHIIRAADGRPVMRSAVGYRDGETIVGNAVIQQLSDDALEAVFSIKRLMGITRSDERVGSYIQRASGYALAAPSDALDDQIVINVGGQRKSAVDISAMILTRLRANAESRLDGPILGVVITVPAYFTAAQKKATWMAGLQAGLPVLRILDEPTAAAIAYGIQSLDPNTPKTIAVFDLGGGTFDISIISMVQDRFVVQALGGDAMLGGDDFDERIVRYVEAHLQRAARLDIRVSDGFASERAHRRWYAELKRACEVAKIDLSTRYRDTGCEDVTVQVLVQDVPAPQGLRDFDVPLSWRELVASTQDLVDRTIAGMRGTLRDAGLKPEDLDHTILVGGGTLLPSVRQAVEALVGREKVLPDAGVHIDPMECVAVGASLRASRLGGQRYCPTCDQPCGPDDMRCGSCHVALPRLPREVQTLSSHHYIVELIDDQYEIIIPKSASLPSEPVQKTYFTNRHNQPRIRVPIYSAEQSSFQRAQLRKEGDAFAMLPLDLPRGTAVSVTIWLDEQETFDLRIEVDGHPEIKPKISYDSRAAILSAHLNYSEQQMESMRKGKQTADADELEAMRAEALRAFHAGDEAAAVDRASELRRRAAELSTRWPVLMERAAASKGEARFLLDGLGRFLSPAEQPELREAVDNVALACQGTSRDRCDILEAATKRLELALHVASPLVPEFMAAFHLMQAALRLDPNQRKSLMAEWNLALAAPEKAIPAHLQRLRGSARLVLDRGQGAARAGAPPSRGRPEIDDESDDRLARDQH